MITRKWVVIFEHPHYPEIYLFDDQSEAYQKFDELREENHREDGHCDGYLYCGSMEGILQKVKTYY
jgi:hypothetical protein